LCEKLNEYFKRLIADQTCQAKHGTKITTIFDKAQEASYAVAEVMAKKIKSHTIFELVILPACCKIENIVFGEEYGRDFENPYVR
jgi:hypothetical protein